MEFRLQVNYDNFPLSTFIISWVIMKHSQFNKHQKTSYDTDMYLQTVDESMHCHNEAVPWWRKVREERKWQRRKRNMFRLYCKKQRPIHQPTVTEGRLRHVSTPPIPERQFRLSLNALEYIIDITKWNFKLITLLIGTASSNLKSDNHILSDDYITLFNSGKFCEPPSPINLSAVSTTWPCHIVVDVKITMFASSLHIKHAGTCFRRPHSHALY